MRLMFDRLCSTLPSQLIFVQHSTGNLVTVYPSPCPKPGTSLVKATQIGCSEHSMYYIREWRASSGQKRNASCKCLGYARGTPDLRHPMQGKKERKELHPLMYENHSDAQQSTEAVCHFLLPKTKTTPRSFTRLRLPGSPKMHVVHKNSCHAANPLSRSFHDRIFLPFSRSSCSFSNCARLRFTGASSPAISSSFSGDS